MSVEHPSTEIRTLDITDLERIERFRRADMAAACRMLSTSWE
jgi:hypothetical protein